MINNIGETTVAKLKTAIKATDFLPSAAIGWLARENKNQINQSGKSVKVSLL